MTALRQDIGLTTAAPGAQTAQPPSAPRGTSDQECAKTGIDNESQLMG